MASYDTAIRATNRINSSGAKRNNSNGGTISNIFAGQSVQQLQRMLEQQWDLLPKQARQLLVEAVQPVDLRALAGFWSLPMWREFARGTIASNLSSTSCLLALIYLKLGQVTEAQALTLNGAFIRQCASMPIENIVKWCEATSDAVLVLGRRAWESKLSSDLPIISRAFQSSKTPEMLEAYCLAQHATNNNHHVNMIGSPVNSNECSVMQYVDQIGDSWGGESSTRNQHTPSPKTASTETQIQLILVCEANAGERHSLSIGSSTTLKTLFNDYAKERGASLRSLRFSYRKKTLFLSSAGNKTPDQLHMQDQDVITVHGTGLSRESGSAANSANQKVTPGPKKVTSTKKPTKKTKARGKKKNKSKREEPVKTLQEWKAQHSNILSKLHEEVHPRLKAIRTRLNALDLKRQLPKQKRKKKRHTKVQHGGDEQRIPHSGVGGKAGKVYFSVHVGEAQHLYKTAHKPARNNAHNYAHNNSTALLDLHGCTREEALRKLDASLPVWVDTAMRGSYPFVIPGTIVCGGGGQVLSETVEQWIREHAQVANAMKTLTQ